MKQFRVPKIPATTKALSFPTVSYISKVDEADMNFPRTLHAHQDIVEVILITSGKGAIFIDEQLYRVSKGDLVIYNSKVLHDELFSEEAVSLYCIGLKNVNENKLRPNALVSDKLKPIFATERLYTVVLSLLQTIFTVVEHQDIGYPEAVQLLVAALLKLVKENVLTNMGTVIPEKEEEKIALVMQIKAFMDDHFDEPFKLKDMRVTKHWAISEYYFAHKFKEYYNYSPIEYLLRRRIGEAQTLLINTTDAVTEIASEVGFNSSAYFATQFKKIVGLTPKAYRKEYTERESKIVKPF